MSQTCGSCKFFFPLGKNDNGECCVNPPVVCSSTLRRLWKVNPQTDYDLVMKAASIYPVITPENIACRFHSRKEQS